MIEGIRNFVSPRVVYLVDATARAVETPAIVFNSILYTVFDLTSLGKNYHFSTVAKQFSVNLGDEFVWGIFEFLIRIVNPTAELEKWHTPGYSTLTNGRIQLENLPSHMRELALIQQAVLDRLYAGNRFEKQVETRLFSLVSGVALATTGVALTVFGAAATVAAMATLGLSRTVNCYAVNNIRAIGFAWNQLHQGVLGVLNPSRVVNLSEVDGSDDQAEGELDLSPTVIDNSLSRLYREEGSLYIVYDDGTEFMSNQSRGSIRERRHQRNNFVFYRVLNGAVVLGAAAWAAKRWARA